MHKTEREREHGKFNKWLCRIYGFDFESASEFSDSRNIINNWSSFLLMESLKLRRLIFLLQNTWLIKIWYKRLLEALCSYGVKSSLFWTNCDECSALRYVFVHIWEIIQNIILYGYVVISGLKRTKRLISRSWIPTKADTCMEHGSNVNTTATQI